MAKAGLLPPAPLRDPMTDNQGIFKASWSLWFTQLYNKIGGTGSIDFVPTIGTDANSGTPAYTTQLARFVSIGTLRMVNFEIQLSNWTGAPTGNVIIGNFPENFLNAYSSGTVGLYDKITLNAGHSQLGFVGALNQPYAFLYSMGSGAGVSSAKIPVANVSTTAKIIGSVIYSI